LFKAHRYYRFEGGGGAEISAPGMKCKQSCNSYAAQWGGVDREGGQLDEEARHMSTKRGMARSDLRLKLVRDITRRSYSVLPEGCSHTGQGSDAGNETALRIQPD